MAVVFIALLAGLSAVAAQKAAPYLPDINEDYTLSRLPVSGRQQQPFTELRVTDNVVSLKRASGWSPSATYVQALRRQGGAVRVVNGTANLVSVDAGSVFLAPVIVGGQSFDVVIDSGSSDPWLVGSNFQCVNKYDGSYQTQDQCRFGPTYNVTASTTYQHISGENFNISYADGETLTGSMGYESFTMGGINVPHQEFALVNYAAWTGDTVSSGLVGFAYRSLTSAYQGTDPSMDQSGGTQPYNPLFVDMYTNQGVPPLFTLAIDRDPQNGGMLALGGVPNIPYSPGFASTPIIYVGVNTSSGELVYEFYTIAIDGFAISADPNAQFDHNSTSTNPNRTPLVAPDASAIVDSGTSLLLADNDTVAAPVAAAFNPPGVWDDYYGVWSVLCNATPPVFGVSVAGKIFYVNGADMILQISQTECESGVQPGGQGVLILGDVWMKNVLCVFDLGAEMMRFAAREYYGLTAQVKRAST
ncbi:hypothetical protein LTR91_000191 [Friedmanniomyces endolithicus]|uniref:Peptidase A1 domain-containing protein n=1 Tax=Friedmanniomyces endolithicus TaxID=329885 RepID=A0AAN6FHK6_9PEZI|nr:hypothetical protein LTR82_010300 [Friedmanniomyces endolithicus]KAK0936018.1 hypothetical protein LTR29_012390 [Friedmanniomyces endolithicus]KAK1013948.1 hypothetical protein LTS01_000477 [Friedmanniomyces endolithicus]KAK1016172.1 hypothetical protein LTR91_000191 [Friedmanniomyces endolithicus]KAK1054567.1 hypothetical protein LTS16_000211 [Friedmanniomyces endolithicus]